MPFDTKPSPAPTQEIASLDPQADCERIAFLLTNQLFPYTIEKSLEYALFKTYAVPSISRILAATGEFTDRAQKRYDDTVLILAEIGEKGHGHPDAETAADRMNDMHGRFRIHNDDFLYTLSAFVFEPIRALRLYGPRPMTDREREAWFRAYMKLGRRMNIRQLPADLEGFRAWREAYEQRAMRYEPTNRAVADATMTVLFDMLKVPRIARPLARRFTVALMEPHVAAAFNYAPAGRLLAAAVNGTMAIRRLIAGALPDRSSLRLQTRRRLPTYPSGYDIAQLGTFPEKVGQVN